MSKRVGHKQIRISLVTGRNSKPSKVTQIAAGVVIGSGVVLPGHVSAEKAKKVVVVSPMTIDVAVDKTQRATRATKLAPSTMQGALEGLLAMARRGPEVLTPGAGKSACAELERRLEFGVTCIVYTMLTGKQPNVDAFPEKADQYPWLPRWSSLLEDVPTGKDNPYAEAIEKLGKIVAFGVAHGAAPEILRSALRAMPCGESWKEKPFDETFRAFEGEVAKARKWWNWPGVSDGEGMAALRKALRLGNETTPAEIAKALCDLDAVEPYSVERIVKVLRGGFEFDTQTYEVASAYATIQADRATKESKEASAAARQAAPRNVEFVSQLEEYVSNEMIGTASLLAKCLAEQLDVPAKAMLLYFPEARMTVISLKAENEPGKPLQTADVERALDALGPRVKNAPDLYDTRGVGSDIQVMVVGRDPAGKEINLCKDVAYRMERQSKQRS